MSIQVVFGSILNSNNNAIETINSKTMTAKRYKLFPEIKTLFKLYPSLEYVSFFLQKSYETMPEHTPEARVICAQISEAISKCISGLMYEIPILNVETELFLAKVKIFATDTEANMMRFKNAILFDNVASGGTAIQLTPAGLQALKELQQWKLADNIIHNDNSSANFNINNKLKELLENVRFV